VTKWLEQGCEACREGVLSGEWSPETVARLGGTNLPPKRVSSNLQAHAYLHHCDRCGAWWEFGERSAYVISEDEARSTFSSFFATR
jgi:hypothetical protein